MYRGNRSIGRVRGMPGGNVESGNSRVTAKTIAPAPETDIEAEFAKFYWRHYEELQSYARRMVGDRDLAEDIVQQAMANTIASSRNGKQIQAKDLSAWLHCCIRNLSIDHHRAHHAELLDTIVEEDDSALLPTARSSAGAAELKESWRQIAEAIAILPLHFRRALILAELKGLSYPEIATALDRSVHSIRQILCRARRDVREIVGRES